jgi:signal transduction histidine kinase
MLRRQLGEQAPAAGTIAEGGSPRRGALQPSELLDKVENNIAAMRIMVHDLLNFTANRQPQRQEVDVRATAGELLEEIAPQCAAQNIRLECQVDDDLTLSCDPEMLRSAVRNLLLNAVDALGGGGTICLTVRPDGDYVRVEVRDNGPGIPAETMARIFDPFFTTKPTGTGLGLSVVERVMECHHGQVRVHRVEPHGTGFRLMFPSHLGRNRT